MSETQDTPEPSLPKTEAAAMQGVADALDGLTGPSARRVLAWALAVHACKPPPSKRRGSSVMNRVHLYVLERQAGEEYSAADVATILGCSGSAARTAFHRLSNIGVIERLAHGRYVTAQGGGS